MTKSRLTELNEAGTDYSLPINAFANHAKRLFNQLAKDNGIKTRIESAEYNDGGARLYVREGYDPLNLIGNFYSDFSDHVQHLASENKKLIKLELPVASVIMGWGEIKVNF